VEYLVGRVKIALSLIACLTVIGTLGYRIGGLGWVDALYQTVITISTVGYNDLADSPSLRPFTIALIGFGTLTLAVLISLVTGAVVETRIRDIMGRRKVEGMVRKLSNHIVVCGFGRFGRTVALELSRKNEPFVVVESDTAKAEYAREHDYLVLLEDATEEDSMTHAGVERARCLLTTLGSDADNVYVTLTAKQMSPKIKVVAIALDERAAGKLKAAGADEVVSPYLLGGNWMAQVVTSPTVADFMKMATGANPLNFYMDEQRIGKGSTLDGLKLRDAPIRSELGVIVVAVRRADGALVTNPSPDIELGPGDVLVSLGEHEKLAELKRVAAGA